MSYKLLSLGSLVVNPNNDRHGEQGSEKRAIAWLLTNRAAHMQNLAKDIVAGGGIYEPPLVYHDGKNYIVADGNRRVTALKLLSDPSLAPTKELETFFSSLAKTWKSGVPETLECRVENDRDEIDEILYRRHIGSEGGVGQSRWDDRAKLNFVERTGKKTKVDVAAEISKLLAESGHKREADRLPRSNLNRLLSAETFRNKLGFTTRGNKFRLTHEVDTVVPALLKVSSDLIQRDIVLADIWDNEGKYKYMLSLEKEGVLPTHESALHSPQPAKANPKGPLRSNDSKAPVKRTSLIPADLSYAVVWTGETARHKEIWHELQHSLRLSEHPNAVAVLFRVLLELSVDHYCKKENVGAVAGDKLANKVEKVAAHMESKGVIEKKYLSELKKFNQSEHVVSAHTMNSYVHSPRFSPSPEHLGALWTGLADFIVACLNC